MRCPACDLKMEVLETRGGTKRTRICAKGHRFQTEEVLVGVLKTFSQAKVAEAKARVIRGAISRAKSAERRGRIEDLLAEHWKPAAIAHEVGCSEAYVRQVRASL